MTQPIEKKVAETILQKRKEVKIGGVAYEVAPPSVATLIEVSEIVATMPDFKISAENVLTDSLRVARHCRLFGDIIAVLVLGYNNYTEQKKSRLFFKKKVVNKRKELADKVLMLSPKELSLLMAELLAGMEIADFFGLTVSLQEVNILKPMEAVTTAFGQ